MGSTGSGRLSDYPGSSSSEDKGGSGNGGASGGDRCNKAFTCTLEEVEQCDYYSTKQDVPPEDTSVSVELRGRLFAIDENGLSVGALPTGLNYLADCLSAGFSYEGRVTSSASNPVASVSVDFVPAQP